MRFQVVVQIEKLVNGRVTPDDHLVRAGANRRTVWHRKSQTTTQFGRRTASENSTHADVERWVVVDVTDRMRTVRLHLPRSTSSEVSGFSTQLDGGSTHTRYSAVGNWILPFIGG